jgi:hypothetical protein
MHFSLFAVLTPVLMAQPFWPVEPSDRLSGVYGDYRSIEGVYLHTSIDIQFPQPLSSIPSDRRVRSVGIGGRVLIIPPDPFRVDRGQSLVIADLDGGGDVWYGHLDPNNTFWNTNDVVAPGLPLILGLIGPLFPGPIGPHLDFSSRLELRPLQGRLAQERRVAVARCLGTGVGTCRGSCRRRWCRLCTRGTS